MVDLNHKLCFRRGNSTYVAYGNTTAKSNSLVVRIAGSNHYFPLISTNSEYGATSPYRRVNYLTVRKNNANYNISSNGVVVTASFTINSRGTELTFNSVTISNNGLNKAMSAKLSVLYNDQERDSRTQSISSGATSVSVGVSLNVFISNKVKLTVSAPASYDPTGSTATYTKTIDRPSNGTSSTIYIVLRY